MRKPLRLIVIAVLLFMSGLVGLTSLLARRARVRLADAQNEVVELRLRVAEQEAEASRQTEQPSDPSTIPGNEYDTPGAAMLHEWVDAHPEAAIPELSLLPDSEWYRLGLIAGSDKESDYWLAVQLLRRSARALIGEDLITAIQRFAADNDDLLPLDVRQLEPYLPDSVTDAMMARYAMLHFGSLGDLADNFPLIGEVAGVDDDVDTVLNVSRASATQITSNRQGTEVYRALYRYLSRNGGAPPASPEFLIPYLNSEIPVSIKFISNLMETNELQILWGK